jgi:hypothetical protein
MRWPTTRTALLLAGLAVVVGLPFAGRWWRQGPVARCTHDGLLLEPRYQVRIVLATNRSQRFCSIRCAGRWLARHELQPVAIYVTDELSGEELEMEAAYFVQSTVVTNPITRNSVHVFRDRSAALEHIRVFGGCLLTGAERPFAVESSLPHP